MALAKQEILIFTDQITNRLNYVVDFINEGQDVKFIVTNDALFFENAQSPKIVYSDRYFETGYLQFFPADLLFEEGVNKVKYKWSREVLCIDDKPDLLAAIFFVLTNYSDYLVAPEYKDKHGRVPSKYNVLVEGANHEKLMVERWVELFLLEVKEELKLDFTIVKQPFLFTPTFDIDIAYAFREKEKWRNTMSIAKDYLLFKKQRLNERKTVHLGEMKDPYDTFAHMAVLPNLNIYPKLFWLLGDYASYDRNISYDNNNQKALIRSLQSNLEIGIHPSYKSNNVLGQLAKEINRLADILGNEIKISRQHYLKVELPKTFKWLIKEGIEHDYSLGFAEFPGFKVGTVRPHRWYNLVDDYVTQLICHPFSYMDGSLLEYLRLSPEKAQEKIKQLFMEVEKYGGEFSFIWHNSTIGDYGIWKGWKKVYDFSIDLGINKANHA
jgi:hypothetical protein